MKTPIISSALIGVALIAQASATDFIRQITLFHEDPTAPAVIYDIPVHNTAGQVNSNVIGGDASLFQLWAMGPNPAVQGGTMLHKLDEKIIGAYYPQALVTLVAQDYFEGQARTRADIPYKLVFNVSGISPDPSAPVYARTAVIEQTFKSYDPETNQPFTNGSAQGTYPAAFAFTENGNWEQTVYQDLPGEDPLKVRGQESFKFFALPDPAKPVGSQSWAELSSVTVQIWPVADAQIIDIQPKKYQGGLPTNARAFIQDLYPRSVTYAQVYPGEQNLGNIGTVLDSTPPFDALEPQQAMLDLSGLAQVATEDGVYTIEILTVTPFNNGEPERLAHLTFELDRTISVRATVTTIE